MPCASISETPPRAWGRLVFTINNVPADRNTPTGVGKTQPSAFQGPRPRKHPHGRGEDSRHRSCGEPLAETPPRAWGRRPIRGVHIKAGRNTPTGVGKTNARDGANTGLRKHPHGRGEDGLRRARHVLSAETPPRAWGRPGRRDHEPVRHGNTPTGVGKTA